MRLGVPVDVQAVRTVRLEEESFEVLLQFLLSDGFEQGDLVLLAVEVVLMSDHLNPGAAEIFLQVFVFFRDVSHDGANASFESIIAQSGHLSAHFCHVNVQSSANVHTVFAW